MVTAKRREGAEVPKVVRPPLLKVSSIECKEVDWLWRPYIPRGMVTLLEGDPGLGKSWITMAIAAAVSTGQPLPGGPPTTPQNVLIGSAEDLPEYSIAPRLKALEADGDRVFLLPYVLEFSKQGIQSLAEYMRECAATILFIDPIQAYLGADVDMHRANEVRPIMSALGKIAEETHSAIILVRHLRKGGDGSGKRLYSGLGSIDFAASVRSILQVERNKSDVTVINHIKSNIAGLGPSLSYTVSPDECFKWGGIVNDADFAGVSRTPRGVPRAQAWLREHLAGGPVPAKQVAEMAKVERISTATLNRAKVDVAESYQTAEGWYWRLLDTA